MVGCGASTIVTAAAKGELVQREASRALPSLERQSVEAFRDQWVNRPRRVPQPRTRRSASAPPDDSQGWLSTSVVSVMLGVRRADVARLVRVGRLPEVKRGVRVWMRRDHAERAATAGSFAVCRGRRVEDA